MAPKQEANHGVRVSHPHATGLVDFTDRWEGRGLMITHHSVAQRELKYTYSSKKTFSGGPTIRPWE